jgi:hypothetical protein
LLTLLSGPDEPTKYVILASEGALVVHCNGFGRSATGVAFLGVAVAAGFFRVALRFLVCAKTPIPIEKTKLKKTDVEISLRIFHLHFAAHTISGIAPRRDGDNPALCYRLQPGGLSCSSSPDEFLSSRAFRLPSRTGITNTEFAGPEAGHLSC